MPIIHSSPELSEESIHNNEEIGEWSAFISNHSASVVPEEQPLVYEFPEKAPSNN